MASVSLRNQSFDKSRFQDLLAIRLAAPVHPKCSICSTVNSVQTDFFYSTRPYLAISLLRHRIPAALSLQYLIRAVYQQTTARGGSRYTPELIREIFPRFPFSLSLSFSFSSRLFFSLTIAQWRVDRPVLVDHSGLMDACGVRFFLALFVGIARVECKKDRSP